MDREKARLDELRQKERKIVFHLGETIYKLYKNENIRFLYTSDGVDQEREVRKVLKLLDYMADRIKTFEEIYLKAEAAAGKERDAVREEAKGEEALVKKNP